MTGVYINHIDADLHSKFSLFARKQRERKIAAFVGVICVFTLIAWLLFQIMPSASLGLKYIFAEVIDIQTIDDGKGDKRNIVVRYEGKQMILISWRECPIFCV